MLSWCRLKRRRVCLINFNFISATCSNFLLGPEPIEWSMNDLLQLRKQPATLNQDTADDLNANVSQINKIENKHQQATAQQNETIVKSKERTNANHKRPSLAHEISCSKRAKNQDTIKPTPQLLQQLMTSTGCNQKKCSKVEPTTSNNARWMSSPQKAQQAQPASNSVLMNLLVSGCDVSAGYYTCLPRPKVAKA